MDEIDNSKWHSLFNAIIMNTDLSNRTCIITGANSGIGKATAIGLAKMGASIVMLCRNEEKGKISLKEIKEITGNQSIELMIADLKDYDSLRIFADNFRSTHDKLHILINNAGIMKKKRETNNWGHETTFATNYLGHFLLTNLLLEMLQSSAPARIINLSSKSHKRGKIDFDNLMLEQNYGRFKAYNNSKLANILFTYELARRLEDSGVTVNVVHPGAARTNFGREFSERTRKFLKLFKRFTVSPEEGAKTSIFLASSPEVENITGNYWIKCKQANSSKYSYNTHIQKRLWDLSEDLTATAKEIQITCPICKFKKIIAFPTSIVGKSVHLTTVSIPKGLVCEHHFQFFIDKDFNIKGYQTEFDLLKDSQQKGIR